MRSPFSIEITDEHINLFDPDGVKIADAHWSDRTRSVIVNFHGYYDGILCQRSIRALYRLDRDNYYHQHEIAEYMYRNHPDSIIRTLIEDLEEQYA